MDRKGEKKLLTPVNYKELTAVVFAMERIRQKMYGYKYNPG